ncbi:hypothetical protein SAMN02910358_00875 [Lachnospiraceae bacterium XBB1006]|nr:hypothetical protein SAMN02910358_00875 [Lachnospiraceae bacterium XBB1006]
MKGRKWGAKELLLCVCLAVCVTGCQKKAGKETTPEAVEKNLPKLTVQVEDVLEKKPFLLMAERGYDEEEGFQLAFSTKKDVPAAILVGEYADVFRLKAKGEERYIIGNATNDVVLLANSDCGVETIAEAKGRTVWRKKDADAYALAYLLAQENYRSDYVLQDEADTYEQVVDAFINRQAELAILPRPYADALLKKGAIKLGSTADSRFCDRCILADKKLLKEQNALFSAFARAYQKAIEDLVLDEPDMEYTLLLQPEEETLYDVYLFCKEKWKISEEYNRADVVTTIETGGENE